MALFLTLLSIALCYFSPGEVLPTLAPYHLQQFILGAAVVISIIVFDARRGGLRAPQSVLMVAFWFAVVMSVLTRGWFGGSLTAFLAFGLVVGVYFLVAINAFSVKRIRIFCRVISLCCLIMAIEGIIAYYTGFKADKLVIRGRLGGYGILNDANDFAQFLLIGLAFLGVSWRKYDFPGNLIKVLGPASVLLYAIFLTSSRGAMFGLAAIVFVAVSARVGKAKAVLGTIVIFVVLLAAGFGGGRDISLHEGSASGRVTAWGSGISQLKTDPLFGVGFGQFTAYNDLTAHNSFVLCFAEVGFFGYFFWLALLVTTVWGLETLAKVPAKTPEDEDFTQCVTVVRAALYAFLLTAWFLSRTYNETLYIILALAVVLICLRREQVPEAVMPMVRWVPLTFIFMMGSVLVIYGTIRLRAF